MPGHAQPPTGATGTTSDASGAAGAGGGDTVAHWIALVDALYPEGDAEGWDSTGLQVGDPAAPVTRVLISLDVTEAVLAEAAEMGAQLVLAHHPLLFRPLDRLTPSTAPGRLALRAARQGIALLAAHTNVDVALEGTTDPVMQALGITDAVPLVPSPPAQLVKLVTFVPPADTDAVLEALSHAGAGRIGEYEECSFRVAGTGTFRPSAAADPAVGERGVRNAVAEDRLEVVLPRPRLAAAIAALRGAHPYEEVAFDVVPLLPEGQEAGGQEGSGKGLGRVGTVPEALSLREVCDLLAIGLPARHLRVAGDLDAPVRRVAACGGAGDSLLAAARSAGAEVYVTGDLRHHVALDALTLGLPVIDAGHHATEAPAMAVVLERLTAAAAHRGLTAGVLASAVRTEPWADYRPPASGAGPVSRNRGEGSR